MHCLAFAACLQCPLSKLFRNTFASQAPAIGALTPRICRQPRRHWEKIKRLGHVATAKLSPVVHYDVLGMSTKSLLRLATEQYDLQKVDFALIGHVRKGGKLAPVWNLPLQIYQLRFSHKVLIVSAPPQFGLFSPAALRGRGTAGGLESLEPGSGAKLACLIPVKELSPLDSVSHVGLAVATTLASGAMAANPGSAVALRHSSGVEFVLTSPSLRAAEKIRDAVTNWFE
jgi:hypothetical protein